MKKLFPVLLLLNAVAFAEEYSPPLAASQHTRLFWGDLHVHSNQSPDSFAFGNTRLTPENAFRFARGEAVPTSGGLQAQLRRPLDFLLVADHAEFIGVFPRLMARDPMLLSTELGKEWRALLDETGNLRAVIDAWLQRLQATDYEQELPDRIRRSIWAEISATADQHNVPGLFTAFVGYEWTSMIEGNNLHRVVLFRDGAERAAQLAPYSALDSRDPEELWAAMQRYEDVTGGRVMAIPHNGNVSNGLMFALETVGGEPLDKDYAERRARWEPVYEVTQVKGDGEAHPFLSPDDEFADFETWDGDNIARTVEKRPEMLAHEYARPALKLGLKLADELGADPFAFGLIGSTDSHTTLATADDDNFWGKFRDSEPSAERMSNKMGGALWSNWRLAASGYAAIWAEENTREALFDALARREVYASTGPRIALRFFGGEGFATGDEQVADLARLGYSRGVPMGGTLAGLSKDAAPSFLVHALKDPDGANLDRVQIIKGWLDSGGELHEQVYDVALSDGREVDPATSKAPPLPSTVDVANATYRNSVGAVSLATVWTDPDFDPAEQAFYYVRVLEIETPRWTAYDGRYFDLAIGKWVPMVTRERAYSSPIWYRPEGSVTP